MDFILFSGNGVVVDRNATNQPRPPFFTRCLSRGAFFQLGFGLFGFHQGGQVRQVEIQMDLAAAELERNQQSRSHGCRFRSGPGTVGVRSGTTEQIHQGLNSRKSEPF